MTARVCPVHGEYAADGICRWCEPVAKPSGANQSSIWLPLLCCCSKCLRTFEAPIPLTSLECPECRGKDPIAKAKAVRMQELREAFARAENDWRFKLRAPPSWRIEYADPARVAARNAAEESRLLAQHAALRWERVARRWATKAKFDGHERTVDGTLAFDDRCSECRRTRRLTDAGIPKEWP